MVLRGWPKNFARKAPEAPSSPLSSTWTYSQLVQHIHQNAAENGHHCLQKISRTQQSPSKDGD